jgi:transposase-like protein
MRHNELEEKMKERTYKKHKQFSIEEKNQIVLLYLDKHMGQNEILRTYNITSSSVFRRWINQYREFGSCVDRRGIGTKLEIPNKGRPRKHKTELEDLNKEQLIEKVRMYQDIKKSLAYLMNRQRNNTTR